MTISVVIPVLHEEAIVNDAIGRIEGIACVETVEIIVVDGSEEVQTLKAVTSSRVKGVVSGRGRGKQMNRGAAAACGDVILFLHVDTELPEGAFRNIAAAMKDGRFAGGAFDLSIADGALAFRVIERVASLRSRMTRIPYGDQGVFFRRDYFLKLGGYRDLSIMEDVDLMRRVKKNGGKICFIDAKVKTSARRWKQEGVFACTLRNWTIMLLYLMGIAPEKLAKWYP